jgi:alpha-N-arabinofuranosidase
VALRLPVVAPETVSPTYGAVPAVSSAATWDEETGRLALFLVNRDPAEDHVVDLDLRAVRPVAVEEQLVLAGEDLRATNSSADPERVRARQADSARLDGQHLTVALPAVSWTAINLTCDTTDRRGVTGVAGREVPVRPRRDA